VSKKILVTGASGYIGKHTLLHLLKLKPASELVALVRDPSKAEDLAALGVEIRQGDYMDKASLLTAFADVEKVMLTSAHAFTDRNTAHGNVIDAAVEAGVSHVAFMSIIRNSDFTMKDITADDLFAENKLKSSGLEWTILRHPPFLDVLHFYIGAKAQETGVHVPAGNGKFAAATRDDLAAAHAAVLAGTGHEGKSYALTGSPTVSFAEVAEILGELCGSKIPYVEISDQAYMDLLVSTAGVPHFIAEFALIWVKGMTAGEWQRQTQDLETLIGKPPTTATEFFRDFYLAQAT
jgi:NAD(P)H dehydrogenase (quinone)